MNWLKGLIAAVVGGVANTITVMVVDPSAFNLNDLPKLGKVAIVSAILSAAFYLKQSPIPNAPKVKAQSTPGKLSALVLFFAFAALLIGAGCSTTTYKRQTTEAKTVITNFRFIWASEGIDAEIATNGVAKLKVKKSGTDAETMGAITEAAVKAAIQSMVPAPTAAVAK